MNNTNNKSIGPSALTWQKGLRVMEQLLTQEMMLSTSADIALKGAHLASKLAVELEWKYKVHTHSQSFKSRQEKLAKAEAEAKADLTMTDEEIQQMAERQTAEESGPVQDTDTSETQVT